MGVMDEERVYGAPIEAIRHMADAFGGCNEGFLWGFSLQSLINIYSCWMRCGWNIYPDDWSEQQVEEAKQGVCPDWDSNEAPLFAADRWESRRLQACRVTTASGWAWRNFETGWKSDGK